MRLSAPWRPRGSVHPHPATRGHHPLSSLKLTLHSHPPRPSQPGCGALRPRPLLGKALLPRTGLGAWLLLDFLGNSSLEISNHPLFQAAFLTSSFPAGPYGSLHVGCKHLQGQSLLLQRQGPHFSWTRMHRARVSLGMAACPHLGYFSWCPLSAGCAAHGRGRVLPGAETGFPLA